MPMMFPSVFPPNIVSTGERKVFDYLKQNAPDDWVVLHSFRIPNHRTVVFGEADFVVVAPKIGVIVLEIKSGGVGFNGTDWVYINRNQEKAYKKRGPFQQAQEAMFEIERLICEKLGRSYKRTEIAYGYGVIFTDERRFPVEKLTEDNSWRLYQHVDNPDYCSFIKSLYVNFIKELGSLGINKPRDLSSCEATVIGKTLRPLVDCVVPFFDFIKASEEDIISLTEEQYSCIDDIELNHHVVVVGGAGTGKTLIAVEAVRRYSQRWKIGFFCFNKNLAEFLSRQLANEDVVVSSLHSYMMKVCGKEGNIDEKDSSFFQKRLPLIATAHCKNDKPLFDMLIVDEFQDLCTNEYFEFLDSIVNGGLRNGRFCFFGDFARQAIFNSNATLQCLSDRAFYAMRRLTINCRNTKCIGNEIVNISGYKEGHYFLGIVGEPVEYLVYNSSDQETQKLFKCIAYLSRQKFDGSSIIILSPLKRENSLIGICDENKQIIGDYGEDSNCYLAMFSTIQAFKGLESPIVILVDIEDYNNKHLIYIALSRARSKLYVLESEAASTQRKNITIER